MNTGRFTRGKGLEDTITKTNLEAAREVVRQLRLRDIGGIIIIDFIDMAHAKNREMVLATLEAELETDRTKTYVVELSPLGLVEMTRQNTTDGARGILTRTCPTCLGKARVTQRRDHGAQRRAPRARPGAQVAGQGLAHRGQRRRRRAAERRPPQEAREAGRPARLLRRRRRPARRDLPRARRRHAGARAGAAHPACSEGQEVELELEFSLTYSPRDAVGYIDGYMVIVEGGRQSLGERRKVRITATARTGAQATVLKQAVELTRALRRLAIIVCRCLVGS